MYAAQYLDWSIRWLLRHLQGLGYAGVTYESKDGLTLVHHAHFTESWRITCVFAD